MKDLWKYCGPQQCREFLLSLNLLGSSNKTETEQLQCLYAVSNHTQDHYQRACLQKLDGGRRYLLVPDPLLKTIQRNLLHQVLHSLPISPCAAAYHKGASIRINGAVHIGKAMILKLDIKDFFDSITDSMVYAKGFPGIYFPPQAAALLTALCCYQGYLPQGAPTSAAISNLVMKDFDDYMEAWCSKQSISYTRYCDDMTFSGEFDWKLVRKKVRAFLNNMGFEINHKKTCFIKKGQQQLVTGIVVNEKLQVPKEYRRNLRQELYYIRKFGAASHIRKLEGCEPDPETIQIYLQRLLGRINYILQINCEDGYFQEARDWVNNLVSSWKLT